MSPDYIYILINFSYILIFGILTMAVMMLNMPKNEEGLKNYRKSRYALGTATSIMTLYCIFRLIIPQHHGDFLDFWLMVTVTLLFSWVTYVSFLYLIETPRYCLKKFIADGIIPVGIMTLAGAAGVLVTSMQKTLMMIDADLSADLSLSKLAAAQNISAGYLSAIFKKETEQTVTDYINSERMQLAAHLLQTTALQVQTIAAHCGILDVQYFSKVFKKYMKKTPKAYRESFQ